MTPAYHFVYLGAEGWNKTPWLIEFRGDFDFGMFAGKADGIFFAMPSCIVSFCTVHGTPFAV